MIQKKTPKEPTMTTAATTKKATEYIDGNGDKWKIINGVLSCNCEDKEWNEELTVEEAKSRSPEYDEILEKLGELTIAATIRKVTEYIDGDGDKWKIAKGVLWCKYDKKWNEVLTVEEAKSCSPAYDDILEKLGALS